MHSVFPEFALLLPMCSIAGAFSLWLQVHIATSSANSESLAQLALSSAKLSSSVSLCGI